MNTFLCEIVLESLPGRYVDYAKDKSEILWKDALRDYKIAYTAFDAFSTCKRMGVVIEGLKDTKPKEYTDRINGPKVSAPEQAAEAFYKSHGMAMDQAIIRKDPKKGAIYVVEQVKSHPPLEDQLQTIFQDIIRACEWGQSMRWNRTTFRFIRPIQSIALMLNDQVIAGELDLDNELTISFGNTTTVHHKSIEIPRAQDYKTLMKKHGVILDSYERRQLIEKQLRKEAQGKYKWDNFFYDIGALAEYPKVLTGTFKKKYLQLPNIIIKIILGHHQKSLSSFDQENIFKILPYYAFVVEDRKELNKQQVIQGFNKVVEARLEDALFFYTQDLKKTLSKRVRDLETMIWHQDINQDANITMWDKMQRMKSLATLILPFYNRTLKDPLNEKDVKQAIRLCKADLTTQMVQELPALQGRMGKIYAEQEGIAEPICTAIGEHYQPEGRFDYYSPKTSLGQFLSIVDKMDTFLFFASIDQLPTGSKDPFAIRRAVLGIIRILSDQARHNSTINPLIIFDQVFNSNIYKNYNPSNKKEVFQKAQDFFLNRLKFFLLSNGIGDFRRTSHPLILNSLLPKLKSDLTFEFQTLSNRILQLSNLFRSSFYPNYSLTQHLLDGFRRVYPFYSHIKEMTKETPIIGLKELQETALPTEKDLLNKISQLQNIKDINKDASYLNSLALLKKYIDDFCNKVMILDKDSKQRRNRNLSIISHVIAAYHRYAHFEAFGGESIEKIVDEVKKIL